MSQIFIEDFGTADAELLRGLGFTDAQVRRGLYAEMVSDDEVEPEVDIRHL